MRDDFSKTIAETLAKRVGNRCSRPECRRATSGPHSRQDKSLNLGVAAHITAASPGGARYDASLTHEQRSGIDNGIWLCQYCAKLIDNDESKYKTDIIVQWKKEAEAGLMREIEVGSHQPADAAVLSAHLAINQELDLVQKVGCPCLELRIYGRSKRPGKVASAALHVCGPHILAAIQDAFRTKFGCESGNDDFLEPPSYFAEFLPGSQPDTQSGFVIEQDDVRKFFLPCHRDSLFCFIEAPPESVSLRITHIDGRSETLLSGVEVQTEIPTLIRLCLDKTYHLKPWLVLSCGLSGRSLQKADTLTPGLLNEKPFGVPAHPDRDKPGDAASDYIRLRAKILRASAVKDLASEEWLLDTLRAHPDKEVRRDAIVALRRLGTPQARMLLTELIEAETNEITRELIIRSFALVGTVADIPRLESLIRAEDSQICREAAKIACHFIRHRKAKPGDGSGIR